MVVYKDTKNGGVALGTNGLTKEKLVAGGIAAGIGVALALILGFGKMPAKKKKKSGVLTAAVLPSLYKLIKAGLENKNIKITVDEKVAEYFANNANNDSDEDNDGIEVVDAIPIESEDEVYEYIRENNA